MSEIFTFFSKHSRLIETVLILINNDDVSNKEPPEVFYTTVKAHIDQTLRYEDRSDR